MPSREASWQSGLHHGAGSPPSRESMGVSRDDLRDLRSADMRSPDNLSSQTPDNLSSRDASWQSAPSWQSWASGPECAQMMHATMGVAPTGSSLMRMQTPPPPSSPPHGGGAKGGYAVGSSSAPAAAGSPSPPKPPSVSAPPSQPPSRGSVLAAPSLRRDSTEESPRADSEGGAQRGYAFPPYVPPPPLGAPPLPQHAEGASTGHADKLHHSQSRSISRSISDLVADDSSGGTAEERQLLARLAGLLDAPPL